MEIPMLLLVSVGQVNSYDDDDDDVLAFNERFFVTIFVVLLKTQRERRIDIRIVLSQFFGRSCPLMQGFLKIFPL